MFMQVIPRYDVEWQEPSGEKHVLTVAEDDLQAVLRSIIRSGPLTRVTLFPKSPVGDQIVSHDA